MCPLFIDESVHIGMTKREAINKAALMNRSNSNEMVIQKGGSLQEKNAGKNFWIKRNQAENFAIIRRFALNLLKRDASVRLGVKNKRLNAGWDRDYLLHLLTG